MSADQATELSPSLMQTIGKELAAEYAQHSIGSRLGIAISMTDSVLDECPSVVRGDVLADVIKTLIANHQGKDAKL